MLGAAQADALGAVFPRLLGVGACVGVGAHTEVALADLVGPPEDDVELGRRVGRGQLDLALDHLARGAVDGDRVAFVDRIGAQAQGHPRGRRGATGGVGRQRIGPEYKSGGRPLLSDGAALSIDDRPVDGPCKRRQRGDLWNEGEPRRREEMAAIGWTESGLETRDG